MLCNRISGSRHYAEWLDSVSYTHLALVTDGRFSGSTRGPCIGHISPEAAAGGPIAAVEDGDRIIIDIPNRRLELDVPEEIIRERLAKVKPLTKPCLLYTSRCV